MKFSGEDEPSPAPGSIDPPLWCEFSAGDSAELETGFRFGVAGKGLDGRVVVPVVFVVFVEFVFIVEVVFIVDEWAVCLMLLSFE